MKTATFNSIYAISALVSRSIVNIITVVSNNDLIWLGLSLQAIDINVQFTHTHTHIKHAIS